ncbi:hypothetical protein D1007_14723 [Hordeum vulgare]|nr:hypothetical protein D1007_14723 [Hordeum vulgare]
MGGRGFRGDEGGEGRFGRGGGGGRIGPGGGRGRGGGGGGRNMVWMREAEEGGQISSNVDPRHGGSDKSRWEAAAMEVQGGTRGEKWGDNSTQVAAGGSAGGRLQETRPQQHPADRRHPTPGKRNASPLVGGAEERIGIQHENEEGNAAKKARFNTETPGEKNIASSSTMGESSAPLGTTGGYYGKNVVMKPVEECMEEEKKHNESEDMLSEEESDEMGNELLIDTMVKEAEKNQRDDEGGEEKGNVDSGRVFYDEITVNSLQIVPSSISFPSKKFLSYLDACMGEPVVTEMDPTVIYDDQKNQSYLVQSPDNSSEQVEVIPTPPVREEMQTRYSKRNVGGNMEHMGLRAERLAQKRDLQGNSISHVNSFEVLSNLEIISAAVQMGVNIPDNDFVSIDIIRELEISRANIAKKVVENNIQQDAVLLLTNAAGETSLVDTEWGGDEDLDIDDFTVVRSRKKERKKVNVTISKPVTRSQKQKMGDGAGVNGGFTDIALNSLFSLSLSFSGPKTLYFRYEK